MKKEGTESTCIACGTKFYRPPSNRGDYCSRPCWYSSKPKTDITTRLWAKIDTSNGPDSCWEWSGAVLKTGYGSIGQGYKLPPKRAHRVAYESVNGPIPDGLHVLHSCDNRLCCNPAHHFLGNAKMNSDDKIVKKRDKNRGEEHHNCKLTMYDVAAIKTLRATHSGRYIAELFNVSESLISNVINGKTRTDR